MSLRAELVVSRKSGVEMIGDCLIEETPRRGEVLYLYSEGRPSAGYLVEQVCRPVLQIGSTETQPAARKTTLYVSPLKPDGTIADDSSLGLIPGIGERNWDNPTE